MSRYSLRRSGRAERDLIDIWRHIAADDPAAADRVVLRLAADMERLRDFPRIGRARESIRARLLGLSSRPYVILYEIDDDMRVVTVLRIVHMARDMAGLFA